MVMLGHLGAVVGAGGLVHEVGVRTPEVIAFARVINEEGLLTFSVSFDKIDDTIGHVCVHGVVKFQGEGRNQLRLFALLSRS